MLFPQGGDRQCLDRILWRSSLSFIVVECAESRLIWVSLCTSQIMVKKAIPFLLEKLKSAKDEPTQSHTIDIFEAMSGFAASGSQDWYDAKGIVAELPHASFSLMARPVDIRARFRVGG
jgi:hypothetical protein